jgi:predicted N-formylglutamate amidohydrolase
MPKSTDPSPLDGRNGAGAGVGAVAGTGAAGPTAVSGPGRGDSPQGPGLLEADEPPAFLEIEAQGQSNFVFVVDHAGRRIPRRLNDLGLPQPELQRHIAWDIGALSVARQTAAALNAPLLAQNYSRLVIDCNRDPKVESSIPRKSEAVQIPGNIDLSEADAALRRSEIFDPYHRRIRALLDSRAAAGQFTILVAQHSMTNVYHGVAREMHAAVLYNRDRRFAALMLDGLRREAGLIIADNQPYFVSDETDYTIPRHAEARGLPHVEIEIRQDLVTDEAGQAEWARRMVKALQHAEHAFLGAHR